MPRITLRGDRIAIDNYGMTINIGRARAVPGFRKSDSSYPLTMEVCRALRREWGDSLKVHASLNEWARKQVQHEDSLITLTTTAQDAILATVPTECFELATALRPYQNVGATFIRDAENIMIVDEPRTGKTLQVIAGLIERNPEGGLFLVVCPRLSIRNVWEREIVRWGAGETFACYGSKRKRLETVQACFESGAKYRWLIVNPEMLRYKERCVEEDCKGPKPGARSHIHDTVVTCEYPYMYGVGWSAIVVDESHKVFGSYRPQHGSQAADGLGRLSLSRTGTRIAVTGTPFGLGGRVRGLFGTLHWLRPKVYTSFWAWAGQYLEVEKDEHGYSQVGGLQQGQSEADLYRNLSSIMLRRTRSEVMPWLPPKVYQDVYCEMEPEQAKQYKAMEESGAWEGITANGALAELTRLKQFANTYHEVVDGQFQPTIYSGKIKAMWEIIESHPDNAKFIIFSQYEKFTRVIVDALEARYPNPTNSGALRIVGGISDGEKQQAIYAFQDLDIRFIVMTTQTGGVSITLDRADAVIMLDEMWSPSDNIQAEDRGVATTDNGRNGLAVYYIRSEGTIDEAVRDLVLEKGAAQHQVLDGRRGLEWARARFGYGVVSV